MCESRVEIFIHLREAGGCVVAMRVIHLACVAPPETGGIGAVAFREVQLLCERGVNATLFAPERGAHLADDKASHVKRIKTWLSRGNASWMRLPSVLEELSSAEVVHLHYPFYGVAEDIAVMRRLGKIKRLVITLHMDATARGWKGLIFNLHRWLFQPFILMAADELTVSSKDYALSSSYKSLVSRVKELPFGVDAQRFSPKEPGVPRVLLVDVPATSRVVLFVGGMDTAHAFKGVPVLIKALAELPSDVVGVFVGDGDLRASFEELARSKGLASRVRFVGRASEEDLPKYYREADIFAFPSTSAAEAFGLVALEAQASGVPVVASDLPGVRTVVSAPETGLLVPPGNAQSLARALGLLLDDPARRARMGELAHGRVLAKYTWERHVEDLIELYKKVCASPS